MNPPLADRIVGSWDFPPTEDPKLVYHFTKDGENYWELDVGDGVRRIIQPISYRIEDSEIIFVHATGWEIRAPAVEETRNLLRIPKINGEMIQMRRLEGPHDFMIGFVTEAGSLERLKATPTKPPAL